MIHLWAAFLFSCFYSYHWNGSVLILSIHVCRTKQIHKCKCHKASIKAYSELPRYKESVKNKKPTQASKLADIAYFHLCQKENRPRLSPGRFTYKRESVFVEHNRHPKSYAYFLIRTKGYGIFP